MILRNGFAFICQRLVISHWLQLTYKYKQVHNFLKLLSHSSLMHFFMAGDHHLYRDESFPVSKFAVVDMKYFLVMSCGLFGSFGCVTHLYGWFFIANKN